MAIRRKAAPALRAAPQSGCKKACGPALENASLYRRPVHISVSALARPVAHDPAADRMTVHAVPVQRLFHRRLEEFRDEHRRDIAQAILAFGARKMIAVAARVGRTRLIDNWELS